MKLKTLIPKSEMRKSVIQRRNNFDPVELQNRTKIIIDRFTATDDFIYANKIHTYLSARAGEIDTRRLVDVSARAGKNIVIPKLNKQTKTFHRADFCGWDQLTRNSDGYLEPAIALDKDLSDIDLIIVPAVAVSALGQRVGYGGGYYDRLIRGTSATKIVLAYEFQLFENIETDIHDIRIDRIITELRIINTREDVNRISELL